MSGRLYEALPARTKIIPRWERWRNAEGFMRSGSEVVARQHRHIPTLRCKPLMVHARHSCSTAQRPETLRLTSQRAQRAVFGLPTWRAVPRTPMKPNLGASRSSRGASHSHEVARAAHAVRGVSGAGRSTRAQFSTALIHRAAAALFRFKRSQRLLAWHRRFHR